ncbi:MAG: selenocysteine-specific translation elongation factor [Betaproteobacteria bacterium]|nr:selenocysteine-specific translation elongation factor [Betaproteobacteria bacterium]
MIVGTAGHIDHGKTSLIRAITGRDTDRLPEEKRRGISIELGYAFRPVGSGLVAFVDVPGHERFVHTMLAGATGIDLALLVVAADDGVMPQTREHLDILRLLGVARGAIALTKVDAVEASRVSEARGEIAAWLAGTGEAAWPVFEVSTRTGKGVPELSAWIDVIAGEQGAADPASRFRLAVDRAFTLAGIGTVVTGTVHAGVVREGDEVVVAPSGQRARVRSIHAQDRPAKEGRAGERCALNLAGLAREDVPRGEWIQDADLANATTRFDAALRLSERETRVLASSSVVHLHHGSRDILARVAILDAPSASPGSRVLAGFTLTEPLPACRGDRFVIRDASAQRTLGGGRVLDIDPPLRYKRRPDRLARLAVLRDGTPAQALDALLEAGPVSPGRLACAWNLARGRIDAMLGEAGAHVAGPSAFPGAAWRRLRDAAVAAIGDTHAREPEMPGLERERLRRIVAPAIAPESFATLAEEMLAQGLVVRRGAFLALPGHKAELAGEERVRWEKVKPLLMDVPFGPPRVRDLAKATGIAESEVRTLLRKVARVGEVTLVAPDHFFLSDAVADLADIASQVAAVDGVARAAPFRDRIGGGRKVAIQILEFFDRVGYTRRVRDDHVLRRDNPWRPEAPVPAR